MFIFELSIDKVKSRQTSKQQKKTVINYNIKFSFSNIPNQSKHLQMVIIFKTHHHVLQNYNNDPKLLTKIITMIISISLTEHGSICLYKCICKR